MAPTAITEDTAAESVQQLPRVGRDCSSSGQGSKWTHTSGDALQEAVDAVFGVAGGDLAKFNFSLTIADPALPDCPLIGCSTGFTKLCGYSMDEIVGRNCRFLVDPVPEEFVNNDFRILAREFCSSMADGRQFHAHEPWMQEMVTDDGVFCAQINARKDGTLFPNMFHLQSVELDDKTYIIGLQTELPSGVLTASGQRECQVNSNELEAYREACKVLSANMDAVCCVLAKLFWFTGPMRREFNVAADNYTSSGSVSDDLCPMLPDDDDDEDRVQTACVGCAVP